MKLRAPAYPLITIDPYFSVWSMRDKLNQDSTKHWTGKSNTINGTCLVDGDSLCFMGIAGETGRANVKPMKQVNVTFSTFSTTYIFEGKGIRLKLDFMSPLLADDLMVMSRPVSYLNISVTSIDGKEHQVKIYIDCTEELCINAKGEKKVIMQEVDVSDDISCCKIGAETQNILQKKGDDIRIDWGYFFLAAKKENAKVYSKTYVSQDKPVSLLTAEISFADSSKDASALVAFAYDDIYSIEYFYDHLKAYWKRDGATIEQAIQDAFAAYPVLCGKTESFDKKLVAEAVREGGEKYADILQLAYRQAVSAHKLVVDTEGNALFISKECFSNGCAATVDVSYPSIPLFLLYNTELIKGMLRPIFKLSYSKAWKYDFAPHDAGQYPLCNGQVYGNNEIEYQMPVEECGNMLCMAAALSIVDKNTDFVQEHIELLGKWADYLIRDGLDPADQLCTDDFAGHLAHNCNLSIKAIMGIGGYSIICGMLGKKELARKYYDTAKIMAEKWSKMAEDDGFFRLAFDAKGTFSMKYNVVWDAFFGLDLFPKELIRKEVQSYLDKRMQQYGMPLDNRAMYTKADWLVWVASLAETKEAFEEIITPLWNAYHDTNSRVPMTDWYQTTNADQVGFQNRSVVGGMFIQLSKKLKRK